METYVRIMTSEGRGAIAVVRVWGMDAVEVVDRVFRPAAREADRRARCRVVCGWDEPDTVWVMRSWRSGSKRPRPSWKSSVTAGPRRSGRSSRPSRRRGRVPMDWR